MFNEWQVAALPDDAVELGRIGEAWGIKGWVKVHAFSADPQAVLKATYWYVLPPEKGARPFEGCLRVPVRACKPHGDGIVAQLNGVDDRTAAEQLRHVRIWVARADFPVAATDEYYWVDLIGLAVLNREGESMGTVRELLSTGPQAVLVLEYPMEDGTVGERMIPFVSAYVDAVDLPAKRITVDWQADY
ncbi:ribosome maturation factor RimM [Curvibacter sp. CHRR-16]|uniref:ribosome maturation factor RimM n=1 Tax=Curvibacter sp. CHRR-16 TaxID=2835872 RepID=UPI001BD91EBF|nr:ribosome maturation factor RimM [Curvibacter sp. CHRR-16]MBT0568701.1 ribosome maturation factor RimM [Curvibacter sp. CHRR-16]